MKNKVKAAVENALKAVLFDYKYEGKVPEVIIQENKSSMLQHGQYFTSIAKKMVKPLSVEAHILAEQISRKIEIPECIAINVVDGFINFMFEVVSATEIETKNKKKIPWQLHQPEELIRNAWDLLHSKNPAAYRPAILEAVSALEVYLTSIVSEKLRRTVPELLLNWLEDKTKMNFHDRVLVFTPVALGKDKKMDKVDEVLWGKYKNVKEFRNRITHAGVKATYEEALQALLDIQDWLSYLGCTIDYDVSLLILKEYLESHPIKIDDELGIYFSVENHIQKLLTNYYPSVLHNVTMRYAGNKVVEFDSLLNFGDRKVVYEYKIVKKIQSIKNQINRIKDYFPDSHVKEIGIDRFVVIFLWLPDEECEMPIEYDNLAELQASKHISTIGIRIKTTKPKSKKKAEARTH